MHKPTIFACSHPALYDMLVGFAGICRNDATCPACVPEGEYAQHSD